MNVIIVGGGAAGFFTAINIAEKHPDYRVTILERSNKLLSKVKVSGGGRCNVTNGRNKPSELIHFYPRGHKKLHPLFKTFSTDHMMEWLSSRGVETKTEQDLRVFPTSDSSQTIIDCFTRVARKVGVQVVLNQKLTRIEGKDHQWQLYAGDQAYQADKLVIATGSSSSIWGVLEQ
ncbi:MAG: NAD(P)/FAD-dependent oxidoreductase, partial [Bacteroidota bacterium]